jgi:sulfoxide reductase heme-binding subunit YedZ
MRSRRSGRRLLRHHLPLAAASALGLPALYLLVPGGRPLERWSLATAYLSLGLLALSLLIGPANVLRRRPNPVSSDARRDIGIWAALLAFVHALVGLQVHMRSRWLYFLRDVPDGTAPIPRVDAFGLANHTGLAATVLAAILLAISSDRALRSLGTARWKRLQRWSYALALLVLAHGIVYQLLEKRPVVFVVVLGSTAAVVVAAQAAGYARVAARRGGTPEGALDAR